MDNSRKGIKNKITNSYGILDYYKYYNKNYVSNSNSNYYVDKNTYSNILSDFHEELSNEIIFNNFEFKLPFRLGVLCLRKFKPKLKIVNNKLINHNPPDFKATKELWEKDEEARENKVLVRHLNKHSNGFIFIMKLYKATSNFKNKSLFSFESTRFIKKKIKKAVTEYNVDALLI